jgi:hypothetical protein
VNELGTDVNVGGVVSRNVTVTAKLALPVLLWLSVALQVTVVVPTTKLLPEAGTQDAGSAPSTVSLAVASGHVTIAVPESELVVPLAPLGTETVGGVVSWTVTFAAALFVPSVQLMVEAPSGKCEVASKSIPGPPAGVQVTSRSTCDFTWYVTSAPEPSVASTGADGTSIVMGGGALGPPNVVDARAPEPITATRARTRRLMRQSR